VSFFVPPLPSLFRTKLTSGSDYSKGPFTMFVKSTQVTDFHTGKEYSYGDNSGSWQSIKVVQGNSTAHESIFAPPPQTLADKWNGLSSGARIAIYASSAGVVTAFLGFALYYCIKQRRRGAREAKLAEQRLVSDRMELDQFKKAGIDPDSFVVANAEYNAKDMRRDGLADKDSYSVPGTPLEGVNEKSWSPIDGAGLAVAGAAPPLRSPVGRVAGAGQGAFNSAGYGRVPDRTGSPAQMASPIRAGPPGMPPSFPPPASPAHRSFSSPNPHMRASPGPQMGGYQDMSRTQSPAQMARPPPQRSFTSGGGGGYRGDGGAYGDARYGTGQDGYGGGQNGYGGGQNGYGGQRGNEYWR